MKSRSSITLGFILASILSMQTSKADLIGNFDGLDFDNPSLPGNGQFDSPAAISSDLSGLFGGQTGTLTFNLTGLNILGDATANDTASLTFNVSATGGNINSVGNDGNVQIGIAGNGAGGLSDPLETLTFSFGSGSVSLGDPGTDAAVNFIGFRNVELAGFGFNDSSSSPDTAAIGGDTNSDGSFTSPDQSSFSIGNAFGNVSSFSIGAGNATDNFSVARLGARIEFLGTATAIPEVSSLTLVSIGSLGLFTRRRRRRQ